MGVSRVRFGNPQPHWGCSIHVKNKAGRLTVEEIKMADNQSLSGLTEEEAREFHGLFMGGFSVFMGIAILAHILVWGYRPWL